MRQDDIEDGRMTEHSRGMGTVTREMVVKRARELAVINGRSEDEMLQGDFDQAKRELTGRGELAEEQEAPRETVRGTRGSQARTVAPHDEQSDAQKLVEEGVADAEHDQMIEATRDSIKRDL